MSLAECGLSVRKIQIQRWIQAGDVSETEFREAVHTVIEAISLCPSLPEHLVIKGGILLAIAHDGVRYTRDIDFSTTRTVRTLPVKTILEEIQSTLARSIESLEYDLDCRIQSSELRPPDPNKNWPTLIIKIGYAPFSDRRRHARLMSGASPTIVRIECSFNEVINNVEALEIAPGRGLSAYTLSDVIAEKFRALIQQPIRNRFRRQDVYDIYMLLKVHGEPDDVQKASILESLTEKAMSRNIQVTKTSLSDSDVADRARRDYGQLDAEIVGKLPPFKDAYAAVCSLYERLPWSEEPL